MSPHVVVVALVNVVVVAVFGYNKSVNVCAETDWQKRRVTVCTGSTVSNQYAASRAEPLRLLLFQSNLLQIPYLKTYSLEHNLNLPYVAWPYSILPYSTTNYTAYLTLTPYTLHPNPMLYFRVEGVALSYTRTLLPYTPTPYTPTPYTPTSYTLHPNLALLSTLPYTLTLHTKPIPYPIT